MIVGEEAAQPYAGRFLIVEPIVELQHEIVWDRACRTPDLPPFCVVSIAVTNAAVSGRKPGNRLQIGPRSVPERFVTGCTKPKIAAVGGSWAGFGKVLQRRELRILGLVHSVHAVPSVFGVSRT